MSASSRQCQVTAGLLIPRENARDNFYIFLLGPWQGFNHKNGPAMQGIYQGFQVASIKEVPAIPRPCRSRGYKWLVYNVH